MTDDHAKAKGSGGKATKPHPLLYEAYNNRGIAKLALGNTIGAEYDFARATRLDPELKRELS